MQERIEAFAGQFRPGSTQRPLSCGAAVLRGATWAAARGFRAEKDFGPGYCPGIFGACDGK